METLTARPRPGALSITPVCLFCLILPSTATGGPALTLDGADGSVFKGVVAADMDQDGLKDLVVFRSIEPYVRQVSVYTSGAGLDTSADVEWTASTLDGVYSGPSADLNSGDALLVAGDVTGATEAQQIQWVEGIEPSAFPLTLDIGDGPGWYAPSGGDYDGDGSDDVFVFQADGYLTGFFGTPSGIEAAEDWRVAFPSFFGDYGDFWYGSFAGDIDGDGPEELLLSDFTTGPYGPFFFLLEGGSEAVYPDDYTSLWPKDPDEYQYAHFAAPGGDINGDGYADVIETFAPHGGEAGVYAAAFLLLGTGEGVHTDDLVALHAPSQDEWFGEDAAGVGDIDGDGFGDLVVGAQDADEGYGAAYVYFGTACGVPTLAGERLTGDGAANGEVEGFGEGIFPLGDLTGDGRPEFAVNTATWPGSLYVFGMDDDQPTETDDVCDTGEPDSGAPDPATLAEDSGDGGKETDECGCGAAGASGSVIGALSLLSLVAGARRHHPHPR